MPIIPHIKSASAHAQTANTNNPSTRLSHVALDTEVVKKLAKQLKISNPALIEQLIAAVAKINQQNIPDEEKNTLITKEYNKVVKEFSASLSEVLQQNNIITTYKNKNTVLNACSAQIKNDISDTDNKVLLDVINKTNINLIGFNGMLEIYKQQVFGMSNDMPKLEDPLA